MAKDFGFLRRDDDRAPIMTGTHIQTYDAATPAKASPLAFTTNIQTITIPANAAEIVFRPSTEIRVSEDADMSSGYFVQPAQTQAYGVAGMDAIYFRGDTGAGTLDFYFILVKE